MNRISQTSLTTIPFLGKVTPTFQQNRVVFIALAIFALLAIVISQFRHRRAPLPLAQLPTQSTPKQQYHHIPNHLNPTSQPQASSQSVESKQTQIASLSTDAGNKPHDTSLSEGSLTSPTTLDPSISEPIQTKPSTPTSPAAAKIDPELVKRILAKIQEEKYSEIISIFTQENLPKQREVFEPLFKSINEGLGKNVPLIAHLRYQYISISFVQKFFSTPTENQKSIFDMHNIALDGNMTPDQKNVLASLHELSITQLSKLIEALAIDDLVIRSVMIGAMNSGYSSPQKSISEIFEAQENILNICKKQPPLSKFEDHLKNFRKYLNQMETLMRQFGEIAEEASSLDENQLQQWLSGITQT